MGKERKCDLSSLLKETPEAYYWIGFILADGSLNNKNELVVRVSQKDKIHLLKLKKFLNIKEVQYRILKNGYSYVSISGMHTEIAKLLRKKFDIEENKTTRPPKNLKKFYHKKKLFFSLLCGFIDGDGSIQNQTNRKDFKLSIKCHSSWIENLKLFNCFIYSLVDRSEGPEPIINSAGYARMSITDTSVLKHIKEKALKLDLPILARKWNIINFNFIGRTEKFKEIKEKALSLLHKGLTNKEIKEQLKVSKAFVAQLAHNNNFVSLGREQGYILKK